MICNAYKSFCFIKRKSSTALIEWNNAVLDWEYFDVNKL